MGFPFEGNQAMHSIFSDDFSLFTPVLPQAATFARNTIQVNPGYAQNVRPDILICDPLSLQQWVNPSDNPYHAEGQNFNEVSSHFI
jgi:hypothetical protein